MRGKTGILRFLHIRCRHLKSKSLPGIMAKHAPDVLRMPDTGNISNPGIKETVYGLYSPLDLPGSYENTCPVFITLISQGLIFGSINTVLIISSGFKPASWLCLKTSSAWFFETMFID